jgi:hypothetical protein
VSAQTGSPLGLGATSKFVIDEKFDVTFTLNLKANEAS